MFSLDRMHRLVGETSASESGEDACTRSRHRGAHSSNLQREADVLRDWAPDVVQLSPTACWSLQSC